MMNDLGIIVCGSGLRDAINPCIFMTCAVLIALDLFLGSIVNKTFRARLLFVIVYVLSLIYFNFSSGQVLVLQKNFVLGAKVSYLLLGLSALLLGIIYLIDWVNAYKVPEKGPISARVKPLPCSEFKYVVWYIGMALITSMLSTIGPVDSYVMLLGNEITMKGHWVSVLPLISGYLAASLWPLWLVWVVISIKGLRPWSCGEFPD